MDNKPDDLWTGGLWEQPAPTFPIPPAVRVPPPRLRPLRPKRRRGWGRRALFPCLTLFALVVGLTVEDARTLLVQNRLTLGSQTQAYSDQPVGTVIAQETAAGSTVKFNSRINVTVSAGPEPAPEPEVPGDASSGGDWWSDLWGGGSSSDAPGSSSEGGASSSDPGLIWPWDWF